MFAAIIALEALKKPCKVILYTDSQYLRDGITKWIKKWEAKGWKRSKHNPVKNVDLWQRLQKAMENHQVEWVWVRGHSNNDGNECADALARKGLAEQPLPKNKTIRQSIIFPSSIPCPMCKNADTIFIREEPCWGGGPHPVYRCAQCSQEFLNGITRGKLSQKQYVWRDGIWCPSPDLVKERQQQNKNRAKRGLPPKWHGSIYQNDIVNSNQ